MSDKEHGTGVEASLHRRTVLKFIAAAPLVATFGFLASPLMRYMKPTMKAGNFFQTPDHPKVASLVSFEWNDFPDAWTCIPFMLPMSYVVFGPEGHEIRETPGYILRTASNEIVAFSSLCPSPRHGHPQLLNFLMNSAVLDCIAQSKTPVLYCPCACDLSTFDLADNGRVLGGPSTKPLRRMDVVFDGHYYSVVGMAEADIS